MKRIVIIGNGISGVTAARHIRKRSDNEIIIVSSETKYFYSRTALMYIYMGHMRAEDTKPYEDWFWEKNRIDLVHDRVLDIDYSKKELNLEKDSPLSYDSLILAVGSKPNKFGWPGQDLNGVQGLYSMQDLEVLEANTPKINTAVIVGGGLIGVELAEMLHSRGKKVIFLVRESKFWGNVLPEQEGELISKHILANHIDLRFNTELKEIIDDGNGWVKAITTNTGETIECETVGLTAGVSPNVEFLKGNELNVERGIKVNEFLETNIPDVYAIGDCADFITPVEGRRNLEQVWYTGRIMGETVAATICGEKTAYTPGPWFNSAKFFEIEYQTYGWVRAQLGEDEEDFYWEHEKGEKCIHIVWEKSSGKFLGLNTFGIRMRHELFDQWLRDGAHVSEVMKNLRMANFDPEFYSHYEQEIVSAFNAATSFNVELAKATWWQKLLKA